MRLDLAFSCWCIFTLSWCISGVYFAKIMPIFEAGSCFLRLVYIRAELVYIYSELVYICCVFGQIIELKTLAWILFLIFGAVFLIWMFDHIRFGVD